MDDDELLTPPELARILKVSLSWVFARTRRKGERLPHIRLGKYIRFVEADVRHYLDRQRDQIENATPSRGRPNPSVANTRTRPVTVAEGPGHNRDTDLLLQDTDLGDQLAYRKIPFVDLNRSMPQVKTVHWAGVTLSMKNMFGIVPGTATAGRRMSCIGLESAKAFLIYAQRSVLASLSRMKSSVWVGMDRSTEHQNTLKPFCLQMILYLPTQPSSSFWDGT